MENSLPKYITLTEDNIDKEHICCAFSDKKCLEGYESKKELCYQWQLPYLINIRMWQSVPENFYLYCVINA